MIVSEFAVVGAGKVGLSLTRLLTSSGSACQWLYCRNDQPGKTTEPDFPLPEGICPTPWRRSDHRAGAPGLILLCVGDRDIRAAAEQLAAVHDVAGCVVLHTSGLLTAEILLPVRDRGASVASFHPLQSFTGMVDPDLKEVPCAIEGDDQAVEAGFAAARQLSMVPWLIDPADKPQYHAAAAVAANLSHVLVAAGRSLMASCDNLPMASGLALAPLVRTSLEAALASPSFDALSGPLSRGDHETVEGHLKTLPEALARAYVAVAEVLRAEDAKDLPSIDP